MMIAMLAQGKNTVEIGHRSLIFTVLLLIFLYVLKQISGIIVALFVAYLIMTAINPLVTALQRIRIPRQLSALLILITILVGLASGIAALIPPVVDQTGNFLAQLPQLLRQLGIELDPSLVNSQLGSIPKNIFRVITSIFSNALAVFTTLVISYYLILERHQLAKRLTFLFGDGERVVEDILTRIEIKLGAWIRGQLILSLIIGLSVYIGLFALSIPYAIPLAIIAGALEVVPNIGPTVSMIPAAIVGFTLSPLHGGAVMLLYFLIQQFENNLIVPLVMQRAVGLNPLVTIVSLMIGLKLGGPLGAILSIPIVLTSEVLFPYFYHRSTRKQTV